MDLRGKSLNRSTVWLTGCTGFIGSSLTNQLIADQTERIVLLSNRTIARPREMRVDRSVYRIDINFDNSSHLEWLSHNPDLPKPHLLIMAGWACVGDPDSILHQSTNVFHSRDLFGAIPKGELLKVAFFGSIEEYGNRIGLVDEDSIPVLPISSYGIGKTAASNALAALAEQSRTCLLHLLISNVYGPNQEGKTLLPQMKKATHFEFRGESYYRDYIYVGDLTKIVTTLLTSDCSGRLNIGSGKTTHCFDFARKAWALMGKNPKNLTFIHPEVQDESLMKCFNISRLRSQLPKNMTICGIEFGLAKTVLAL